MPEIPRLRVVATNDLLGSFHPWPTSYGRLPGGAALRDAVLRLKSQGPALWADAGDFAQGGVISTLTGGLGGFTAMDELGPDVAAAGNHEFDWGTATVRQGARLLSAPLLCANHPAAGLPATAAFELGGVTAGVVGCTTPDLFRLIRERPEVPLAGMAGVIGRAARTLRGEGCDLVIAIVHDGVDWRPGPRGVRHLPARFAAAIRPWAHLVDVIVAGHTLGRWIGTLHGTPVLQPWAFGQEIGVVEFDSALKPARMYAETPGPPAPWHGHGGDLIAAARSRVVGTLARPLRNRLGTDRSLPAYSLPAYVAAAMAGANDCDIGIFGCWSIATGQPPLDGVLAWLDAGEVTEADVLRLVPYSDDSVVLASLTESDLARLRRRDDLAVWARAPRGRAAMTRYASTEIAAHLGRPLEFEPADTGVRPSLRIALSEGDRPG
ncbi:2',3'-cyclic-nucleotide 2'-phosphodiesterase (5'-nucleotidase family) [Thermocatellispora tengchongensis]|uniref:2',3'-cyclic-nucleotide 2'-phosphodiesterase (5'-nucleotidase family) n=2 Tax=Thermocatellispora tengchongensis TaxID=1073253 RepID=A0A840PM00_9ACTN|nr:metallophosphoesterase [Thermocatellispora tengchongensis]MBB5139023.1 2',3'-cyclic-nucleotide 2'-phosphodiesterase (5'-nucleotidase family) [Thermocatellispora tengchongensis]